MRLLSEATSRITGQSFSRKFVALGRIVSHWEEIVGAELALKTQPTQIRYNRKHKRIQKPEAVLDVAASSADATVLHYQKDLMIERINQIFGDRWITAINFVSTPLSKPRKAQKSNIPLTEAEKNSLSHLLTGVADSDIRKSLESLGHAILTEDKK
jgi:hypothetical protein